MKSTKNFLIALMVIAVIVLAGVYFLPNHYAVINTVEINKPADVVYAQISDFNKWGNWSPWKAKDPNAKYTFSGTPGTKGHQMDWDGESTGKMTVISAAPNASQNDNINFMKPHKGFSKEHWKLEDEGGGKTKLTWTIEGWWRYPVGRLKGLALSKTISADIDAAQKQGLDNLKKYCESMPAPQPVAVDSTAKQPTASSN